MNFYSGYLNAINAVVPIEKRTFEAPFPQCSREERYIATAVVPIVPTYSPTIKSLLYPIPHAYVGQSKCLLSVTSLRSRRCIDNISASLAILHISLVLKRLLSKKMC